MFGNSDKTNAMDAGEVKAVGTEFATKYFDALMGKPNPLALRELFTEQSVFVFAQRGLPDLEMYGLYVIGCFIKRMAYGKSKVTVHSVDTTAGPRPAEFAVTSVCELLRTENDTTPCKFVQTFVIRPVPWTTRRYRIVETKSTFDVQIEDDYLPKSVPVPTTDREDMTSKTAAVTASERLPVAKVAPVTSVIKKSSPTVTDISGKIVNARVVFDNKVTGKPHGTSAKRNGRLKIASSKNVRKHSNEKAAKDYGELSTTINKPAGGNATISKKKVAENPMAEMESVKNPPKVVSKKSEKPTTEKKIIPVKKQKSTNIKSTKSEIPVRVDKKPFISTNRFGVLAVDNDDTSSIILDVQNNHSNPLKDASEDIICHSTISKIRKSTVEKNKSPKSPVVIPSHKEQAMFTKKPLTSNKPTASVGYKHKVSGEKSEICEISPVHSSGRVKSLAKSNDLKHAGTKALATADEGCKAPRAKKISVIMPKAGQDGVVACCNGRSRRSRKNRK